MNTMTEIKKVEINIPTPVLDVIDRSLSLSLKKNLNEIAKETNAAIERGVKTDETLRDGNAIAETGNKAIKITNQVRMQFTRPIDEGKANLIAEVKKLLSPLATGNEILNQMVLSRKADIQRKINEKQREYEEKKRKAEAEARAREEHNKNISLSKGGDGNVKPVVPEVIEQPVSLAGLRSTVRTRSIPDQVKIEQAVKDGIREIPGVSIYQVWQFSVVEAKIVPKEYRRDVRG